MSNAIVRGIERELERRRSARLAFARRTSWEYCLAVLVALAWVAGLFRDYGAVTAALGVWASVEAIVWYFGSADADPQ